VSGDPLQHTATHSQHNTTHCNSLQHTATHCNTLQRMYRETHSNILLHTPDTLQLTVTNGNIMQHTATHVSADSLQHTATHCNMLQLTVTHGTTLQHTATHVSGDSLQHTATHSHYTAIHRDTQRNTAKHCNVRVRRLTATCCNKLPTRVPTCVRWCDTRMMMYAVCCSVLKCTHTHTTSHTCACTRT